MLASFARVVLKRSFGLAAANDKNQIINMLTTFLSASGELENEFHFLWQEEWIYLEIVLTACIGSLALLFVKKRKVALRTSTKSVTPANQDNNNTSKCRQCCDKVWY